MLRNGPRIWTSCTRPVLLAKGGVWTRDYGRTSFRTYFLCKITSVTISTYMNKDRCQEYELNHPYPAEESPQGQEVSHHGHAHICWNSTTVKVHDHLQTLAIESPHGHAHFILNHLSMLTHSENVASRPRPRTRSSHTEVRNEVQFLKLC